MLANTPRLTRFTALAFSLGLLTALLITAVPLHVSAAATLLGTRSDEINTSVADAVASHLFSLTMLDTTTPVGSISFQFCANTPIPNTACTYPAGFDATGTILNNQTGDTGFSIHPNSTANRIVITRPPLNPTAVLSTYLFTGVTNPSNPGSYYVRLQTYTSTDGTGPDTENAGVVFAIVSTLNVNAEVPPYIRFCASVTIVSFDCSTATSFFIDFGELRTTLTSRASSQFVAATNAALGYSVTMNGTTLTSGTNTIPALSSPTAAVPGVSQFGLNLKANTVPSIGAEVVGPGTSGASAGYDVANLYKFHSGDTLVTVNHSDDNRKFTLSYITNINTSQVAGVYATTITYICLANF